MELPLDLVDELIKARRTLQGGVVGAPRRLEDGGHEGRALNRACVVMLSSTLQAFVGEVFIACSEKAFGHGLNADERKAYDRTWSRWGNPSDENITGLFRRLGVHNVFNGLSWQGQGTRALQANLRKINQVRNCIAHGSDITVDGQSFNLTLIQVQRWRRVASTFGQRFGEHALNQIR